MIQKEWLDTLTGRSMKQINMPGIYGCVLKKTFESG